MTASFRELKAREIMHRDVITVSAMAPIHEFLDLARKRGITGAPIVDETGRVVGVVSISDVTRYTSEHAGESTSLRNSSVSDFYSVSLENIQDYDSMYGYVLEKTHSVTVREIMTDHVIAVTGNDSVQEVARLMVEKEIHRVIVMDQDHMAGIITTTDILRLVMNS